VSCGEESAAHERRFIALAYPERIVLLPYNNIAAMMHPFLLPRGEEIMPLLFIADL